MRTAVMIGVAVLLGGNLLFAVPSAKPSRFKGYHTVYYRGPRPLAELSDALLRQPDVETVISRATADILYTNFDSLMPLPLSRVSERFDPRDPRWDDYMRRVDEYFTVKENNVTWDVLYVATRRNPLSLSLFMTDWAGKREDNWRILELDNNETTVIIAAAGALFFLALMFASRKTTFHILFGAGVLPWMLALTRGGIGEFLLFFFLSYYWARFLNVYQDFVENRELSGWKDSDRKPLWLRLVLYTGVLLLTFFFTSLFKSDLLEITLALLAQGGLLAAHWGILRLFRLLKERSILERPARFKPLTILRSFAPKTARTFSQRLAPSAAVGLLVLMPAVLLFKPQVRNTRMPVPEARTAEQGITLGAVRRLAAVKRPGDLPDLSDFVTHAAYQERLAYGAPPAYALPGRNDAIVLAAYRMNEPDITVKESRQTLIAFGDQWLDDLARRVSRTSVERMLFDQGKCLSVSFRNGDPAGALAQANWTIIIIFSIVLCPVILLEYTALPSLIYGRKKRPITTSVPARAPAARKPAEKKTSGRTKSRGAAAPAKSRGAKKAGVQKRKKTSGRKP